MSDNVEFDEIQQSSFETTTFIKFYLFIYLKKIKMIQD